jgi:hypothetical protein
MRVAVNGNRQSASTQSERATQLHGVQQLGDRGRAGRVLRQLGELRDRGGLAEPLDEAVGKPEGPRRAGDSRARTRSLAGTGARDGA